MKTILIIEDDMEVCESTKVLLEDEYKVLTAFSGKGGLNILSKQIVSLIILDYRLPDIDGIEVLKNIKTHCRIPVIMITGYGDKDVVLKSWRYRADYYFDKPVKIGELKEKIMELLNPCGKPLPFEALNLNPSGLSPDIRRALEFIGSNLLSPHIEKLTLKEISAVTTVSPKYLSELFKKEFGQSIYQILTNLKIEKAKELLKKSN